MKLFKLLLFLIIFLCNIAYSSEVRWVRIGNLWDKILDYGDEGYGGGAYTFGAYYYNAFDEPWQVWDYRRLGLLCKNWTGPDGTVYKYKMTGYAAWSNPQEETMAVPFEDGATIHRFFRYEPPKITVDGLPIEDPFPRMGDYVNPDSIPGTADLRVSSHIRTSMGVDIVQDVYVWSQKNHDDYIIYDYKLINTGNIDLDEEVELPDQVIDSFYFYRSAAFGWCGSWLSYYGSHKDDSLRLMYNYPEWSGSDYDDFGTANKDMGFIQYPWWQGWAFLHIDKSAHDHSDDPSQPRMIGFYDSEIQYMRKPPYELSDDQQEKLWITVTKGLKNVPGVQGEHPDLSDIGEANLRDGIYHEVPMDIMAKRLGIPYPNSWEGGFAWVTYRPIGIFACGPYTLNPGDTIRIVMAHVMGSISPEIGWDIGKKWKNEELKLEEAPDVELPPMADLVYNAKPEYDDNDKAKDKWVMLAKDSLFENASHAKWAVRNNFQVPVPPPPPSIEVISSSDKIVIRWGNESESAPDLVGYRVYRAVGSPYYSDSTMTLGKWEMIYECGKDIHEFEDKTAQRGFNYYYYVAAYDDGSHPEVPSQYAAGVSNVQESLESGRWLNYTRTQSGAARLKKPAGKELKEIKIVPNPYNVKAFREGKAFTQENKIMFLNLPPVCTIKIYTETGDLVRTIYHTDGSGDEEWVDPTGENYMNTNSDQIPVSGIYIAHIETPDGKSINKHFVIIR